MDRDSAFEAAWDRHNTASPLAGPSDDFTAGWQAALAYARGEREGWKPISVTPDQPMPVIYYSMTRDFGGEGPRYPDPAFAGQPYRDERCDLGYWDGKDWCWQGTGHAVWENPEDEQDPDNPTHWKPFMRPPIA